MIDLANTGGLSKPRLGRLHDAMARHVNSGDVPGLVEDRIRAQLPRK
jgi:hypothetical protein